MEWHQCRKWWKRGIDCPFAQEEEHEDDDQDDPVEKPPVGNPFPEPKIVPPARKETDAKVEQPLEEVAKEVNKEIPEGTQLPEPELPGEPAPLPFPDKPDPEKEPAPAPPQPVPVGAGPQAQLGGGGGARLGPAVGKVKGAGAISAGVGALPGLIHAPSMAQAGRTTMNALSRAVAPGAMSAARGITRSTNAGLSRPTNAARLFAAAESASAATFRGFANSGAPVRSGRSIGALIESLTRAAAPPQRSRGRQLPGVPPVFLPGRGRSGRAAGGGGKFFESAAQQMGHSLYF